ncbi:primase-helicase family protein [Bradyrhizobium algeriense]|uniref:primase-helicase family protein n=1 Tax=Bradyrhizobium algeriense TaxID=634784 RepID=UPI002FEE699F
MGPVQQTQPTLDTVTDTGKPEDPDAGLDARIATLLLKKPTTDRNAVQAFMAAVVPWPASPNDAGWVNLHWSFPDKNSTAVPKTNVLKGGKPCKNIADFMTDVAWRLQRPEGFKDMFFCTSMQRDHKTSPNGTRRAAKSGAAALALTSIWVDIDVKAGDPKHYHTEAEALKAILLFAKTVRLPDPSAIVRSGGGLHIYWISREALSPQEWLPYAQGLKTLLRANNVLADTVVTTDAARLLRVPGTLNHKPKYPQPMPVGLVDGLPLAVYDFPKHLMFLQQFAGPMVAPTAAPAQHSIWADDPTVPPCARDSFKNGPAAAFAMLKDEPDLNAGIDKHEDHKLDPRPIFTKCGFYRDALLNGGKDYDNFLWHLSILGTTFMQNGNAIAHAISKDHATYSEDGTQKEYDRAVAERADRGFGWPSCITIAGAGCEACKTCPLLAKGKSPLNIKADITATVNPADEVTSQAKVNPGSNSGYQHLPNPAMRLMGLRDQGADIDTLFAVMNEAFAVTKYGGQIVIALLFGNDISFMTIDDFHKMFANLVIFKQTATTTETIKVSRRWFEWTGRRQYLGRGVVFEPGGPLDIPNDMLNLWRGFGVTPKPGNWALLRSHMLNVVCSGNQQHFDYLLRLLAYRVQHLGTQTGVAVALLGAPGAGKGVLARTFGHFFGKHFAHITHGDQLTGRFNAALGTASTVFLDEALWAGDKKGEGVLKALITEPQFQLEAKFRDPIMVKNLLFIMVASNNEWAIPAGMGDRRWFVLDVADTYAGLGHQTYFAPLYAEIENGGAAAMLHDLLNMDLKAFDVRAIPHTAAKAKQQALSLHGALAWLYDVLQEGSISSEQWQDGGLTIDTDRAYMCYVEFSKRQRDWKPEIKSVWSKNIRAALGSHINPTRPTKGNTRVRSFQFAPLDDCRRQFASHLCAPDLEWEMEGQPDYQSEETG